MRFRTVNLLNRVPVSGYGISFDASGARRELLRLPGMLISRGIVIVLLLTLSACTGCDPVYLSDEAAFKAMKDIFRAARKYEARYGEAPMNTEQLENEGMLELKQKTKEDWKFYINWPDEIIAVSTFRNPGGEGRELKYDIPEKL